jgi:hypothetical protein
MKSVLGVILMRFIAALKNGHTHFRNQWLGATTTNPSPEALRGPSGP